MDAAADQTEKRFCCPRCGGPVGRAGALCFSCEAEKIKSSPEKTGRGELSAAMSSWDAAQKWGITKRRVAKLCSLGRIPGAFKKNQTWYIPADAPKPQDGRERAEKPKSGAGETYLSSWEAAQKWGLTPRYVAKLCGFGKIPGAVKREGDWRIPASAENPRIRPPEKD